MYSTEHLCLAEAKVQATLFDRMMEQRGTQCNCITIDLEDLGAAIEIPAAEPDALKFFLTVFSNLYSRTLLPLLHPRGGSCRANLPSLIIGFKVFTPSENSGDWKAQVVPNYDNFDRIVLNPNVIIPSFEGTRNLRTLSGFYLYQVLLFYWANREPLVFSLAELSEKIFEDYRFNDPSANAHPDFLCNYIREHLDPAFRDININSSPLSVVMQNCYTNKENRAYVSLAIEIL